MNIKETARLSFDVLKRTVDYTIFEFETTEQVQELTSIVGQERGRQVMNFGLNVKQIGYNIYVAGIPGTGKNTFTHSLINEFAQEEAQLSDWCYVYNFEDEYKPKILQLPVGLGKKLQVDMQELIQSLREDIPRAFNEENYQKEKALIIRRFKEKSGKVLEKLNSIALDFGFIIRQSGTGFMTVPLKDGEPINEEDFRNLDEGQQKQIEENSAMLQEKVLDFTNKLRELEKETKSTIEKLDQKVALVAAGYHLDELKRNYKECRTVIDYLEAVQTDILNNISDFINGETEQHANPLQGALRKNKGANFPMKYEVNLLVEHSDTEGAPVITADNPTYYNLVGKVEYEGRMGVMTTNFTKIKPGYLHKANGGYLIIQAKDILTNSYAWEGLKRALLNSKLQIENLGEHTGLMTTTSLSPEPMPLDVKVVLIGNLDIYQSLYHFDEDFSKLFKIKADFDVEMNFNLENMNRLASFIHTHCEKHQLRHFDRTAVAKLVEYSIRLVGHQDKLSTRFNQLVEIIYEADTWAKLKDDQLVSEEHIVRAIKEREYRSNLYEEKIHENINAGLILIDTYGKKVGQVNGLAVYNVGQYSFGKPTRITATTFVGRNGIINIERESKMSGNLHNKGVYILGGYLGQKFAQKQPLALTASLAFEQSYGGIDGDSASSTELYALLSSLAEIPINQALAVTGSVNQKGEIQPIGGVNEKIEGFFKVCKERGLTGKQGVLIPYQNVKNLMLKEEVIEAVKKEKFHIFAVKTVEEGIEILTDMPAGEQNELGEYADNTIFKKVEDKLKKYIQYSNRK